MSLEVNLIKQPNDIAFSGNPIEFVFAISPYGKHEKTVNTQLSVVVYVETYYNSGQFIRAKAQTFFPTADGLIDFDIRSYVDPYLSFTKVPANLTEPIACSSHHSRCKISYQLLQNNSVATDLTETTPIDVIKGGLPYEQWHPTEYFTQVINTQKKALNYEAPGELVGKDDTLFLYWLQNVYGADEQFINVAVTYEDGRSENQDYDYPLTSEYRDVCCLPVGSNRIGLDALFGSGSTIVSYTFTVRDRDNNIIVTKTYRLDYRTFYRTEQLIYRNSVGALETIRLRGQIDFEADYARQNAMRITMPAYFTDGILHKQNSNYFTEETEKKVGDTGFLSKSAQQKIRALFLAEEVYEVVGDQLLPVTINTTNAKFYTNKDSLTAIQIEWKKAYVNQFYLPVGTMPQTRSCPAMLTLLVRQTSYNILRIMWSLPLPYDKVLVSYGLPDGSGGFHYYSNTYTGNSGVAMQYFPNPATTVDVVISVKARVICNPYSSPMDMGPERIISVTVTKPLAPVANNDYFNITPGHTTAITLPTSVLANDYDPQDEDIEAIVTTGATDQGGTYSINAAGIVSYLPPSGVFLGQDFFTYQIRKVGGTITSTATCFINSATTIVPVFVKLITEGTDPDSTVYIRFFTDNTATTALDVTGFGININYKQKIGGMDWYSFSPLGTSTQILIYSGRIVWGGGDLHMFFHLEPGTGYTIIP
jgi:hypothetical protein